MGAVDRTPQWLRFTEYVIDRDGRRTNLTPHHVTVQTGDLSGHATYAWTGCADLACGSVRRYQIGDVKLSP